MPIISHKSGNSYDGRRLSSAFAAFEHDGWQTLADAYERSWGQVTNAFVDALLDECERLDGVRLLDVATGPGYAARAAKDRGAVVTGVDFSSNMIDRARASNPDIRFEIGDVHRLPFGDGDYGAVVSNFGTQHFADPSRALREIFRVLEPGGVFAATIWAANAENPAGDILERAIALHAVPASAIPDGPDYHEFGSPEGQTAMLAEAGFSMSSIRSRLLVVPWLLHDPNELFDAELAGSVRSGARLREQPRDALLRIRATMADLVVRGHRDLQGYSVPMAAYVVSGRRP